MESNEPRFTSIGLSNDGTLIFCALDNGKVYALPVCALERAENWNPAATPKKATIIHDGYAALVEFKGGIKIDFPADFVLHICEPSYAFSQDKARAKSGVGQRIRDIREARGLTLDALADKCGIAKPNLSRLENDKVTPKFATLQAIAAALDLHPALLIAKDAWTWTLHAFNQWWQGLRWKDRAGSSLVLVRAVDLVQVFLATRPEHRYARMKLLKQCDRLPANAESVTIAFDRQAWDHEKATVDAA